MEGQFTRRSGGARSSMPSARCPSPIAEEPRHVDEIPHTDSKDINAKPASDSHSSSLSQPDLDLPDHFQIVPAAALRREPDRVPRYTARSSAAAPPAEVRCQDMTLQSQLY